MNKVIMMGRLTKDPEIRSTQSGMTVARFSLAVDRRTKEKKTDFFNCTAFDKRAEFAEKYLKKGTKILLAGSLQNDEYTNKEGRKVTSTGIIIDEMEFAESKAAEKQPKEEKSDFMDIPDSLDEELPFNF